MDVQNRKTRHQKMEDATGSNNSPHPMKDMDLQGSYDLYDSTSDSSSDSYISDIFSETDSDDNLIPDQTKIQLLDEMDVDESGSASSPVGETTSDKMSYDKQSLTSEESETAEAEPSSSQDTKDGIVVSAYQKRGGSRVYNKRHYCLYCRKPYAKMARHLECSHKKKSDVAQALSFPKGSKERRKLLDYIRNRGNYAHNAAVVKSGKGELVPFKRPPKEAHADDFMHCVYCQGLFIRKVLWRHMRSCRLKPRSVAPKPGKYRVQSLCRYTGPLPSNMSKQLWGVITTMTPDSITDIVKNDKVIIDFGQHLLNKGGISAKNKQSVREKMRELGRLLENARRVTTLKTMKDCVNPKKYMETVKAVKYTCGYDSESDKYLIPTLATKLGNSLVKVNKVLKAQGLLSNNKELVKTASEFQDLHEEKWNEMISATALRNIKEAKNNVPSLMRFTEDVQKLHAHLSQLQEKWSSSLSESPSAKAWSELAKVCLVQVILFNRRREEDVASILLSAFLSRHTLDPHLDVGWALSEVEKVLCRSFSMIVTRGTHGWLVPVLLTPKMLCALELLVQQREASGILKDNGYLFAKPEGMTHFQGSDCLRGFAKACGAKFPKSLTSNRMRKQAATLSTVLNMTDTEMEQLANFLGYYVIIHREFFRLPEKTLQYARISKVLMALEQGRLAEFQGKTWDEIGIGPEEKVPNCDEDDGHIQQGHTSATVYGKITQRKKPWQQTEVQAVQRHMMHFITSCTVPAKSDCEKCLKAEPEALKDRDWKNLKFFIYNRITAYKKNLQCK
ncbi:uncharacterized protein [Pseudorasbora parva]|uniref:uncharacterized protein n=1 Tax=Pseudorasbora parva TaxID=51549 RepID=UPI00351EBC75